MIIVPDHGNLKGLSYPRSIVHVNGHEIMFDNWSLNLNSTHQADDFTVEMPFKIARNMPGQSYLVNTPEYASYFFTEADILIEIFVGFTAKPGNYTTNDLTRIMYGYMDEANIKLAATGEKVTIHGRNQVAPYIDNKTTQKYQNMTASAIASMFAQNHGMDTQITPTYTLAGTYYSGDSVILGSDIAEWDLLTYLAEQEGFDLRVRDNTLCFGPFDTLVGDLTTDYLPYTWGQNILDVEINRQPHAAKNITVEVHSSDKASGKHVKGVAKRGYSKATNTYVERYHFAGLTQDQAQKKATSILDQLSRLEVMGTLSVAGNEKLTVDRKIALYGVGAGLSDYYYVRKASHRFDHSAGGGYTCDVTFSNLLLPDENAGGIV